MRSQPKIRASIPAKIIQAIKGIEKILTIIFSPVSVSSILMKIQIAKSVKNKEANPDILFINPYKFFHLLTPI